MPHLAMCGLVALSPWVSRADITQSTTAAFQSVDRCAVLLPESFRGGCSFGARLQFFEAQSLPRTKNLTGEECGVALPRSISTVEGGANRHAA